MYELSVYQKERDDGLESAIRSSDSVAIASLVTEAGPKDFSDKAITRLKNLAYQTTKASKGDLDLHYLETVLVTTGWNKNDDVFDNVETWLARSTPADKQLNYEHGDANIVGHITSSLVIDADGKTVDETSVIDALPAKFHIVTGGVLYKCWATPALQERMDTILAEIAEGKWFVSMECLFKGFDYGLKARDGTTRIVARNDKTAFLSKHLRVYGGKGVYGEYKVGRLMRNIIFSGMGLVKDPANPESVILKSDTEEFTSATSEYLTDFSTESAKQVYLPHVEQIEESKQEIKNTMTITIEQVQAELAAAKAENEKLKASQTETVVNDLKKSVETAVAAKATADELLKKASEALATSEASVNEKNTELEAVKASLEDTKKKLDESAAQLAVVNTEKTKVVRLTAAKDKLKFADDAAATFVEKTISFTDEAFASHVELMLSAMGTWTTNNPASGNTAFSGAAPKDAPKATDKPHGPKATDKPAPMAAKGAETDAAGEAAAEDANLEGAKANVDPALSTSVTDSGVNELQKTIAMHLGFKDESAK